jgi:hypothetical protein
MGFFDFLWLSSEERNIIKKRRAEQTLKEYREEERPALPAPAVTKQEGPKKAYEKIYFAGGSTTVVLPDGISLTKENTDVAFVQQVKDAADEKPILQLFQVPVDKKEEEDEDVETPEERELVVQNLDILEDHEDFVVRDKDVYMRGVKLAMPAPVIAGFIEILEKLDAVGDDWDDDYDWDNDYNRSEDLEEEEEKLLEQYQSLKMFWLKLATSPRKESRDQVLTFCRRNDVRLSKTGNIIAYRRVVEWDKKDDVLNKFVEASWDKVKGWKKNPGTLWCAKMRQRLFYSRHHPG